MRPSKSLSCICLQASFRSSSLSKLTNPKPLDLPVILSSITDARFALNFLKAATGSQCRGALTLQLTSQLSSAAKLTVFQLAIAHMPGYASHECFALLFWPIMANVAHVVSTHNLLLFCVISAGSEVSLGPQKTNCVGSVSTVRY